MALNKQPSVERYTFTVIVLDFKKTNHPPVHMIASKGPALEMVLDFENSESCSYFHILFTNLSTSLYNELHNSQQSLLFIPSCNIYRRTDTCFAWLRYCTYKIFHSGVAAIVLSHTFRVQRPFFVFSKWITSDRRSHMLDYKFASHIAPHHRLNRGLYGLQYVDTSSQKTGSWTDNYHSLMGDFEGCQDAGKHLSFRPEQAYI